VGYFLKPHNIITYSLGAVGSITMMGKLFQKMNICGLKCRMVYISSLNVPQNLTECLQAVFKTIARNQNIPLNAISILKHIFYEADLRNKGKHHITHMLKIFC